MGHVPRRVGHGGCPVGSRALERQYRDRQAVVVARVTREGKDHDGRDEALVRRRRLGFGEAPGLPARRRRRGRGRTGVPARRCGPVGALRLAGVGGRRRRRRGGGDRGAARAVVDALLDRGFAVHAINPKQLDRLRDRFSMAGAKDDRRDARVAAAGLRTDPHLFRPLQVGDPAVIELREWSRLAEELQQERVRLANRIRQQLWRYYPQLLELTDDLTAEWILELWAMAPTPAEAARLREATIAKLLRQHRIRRLDAAGVLGVLRQPAITVAAGVTEAAVLHLRSLMARLRLPNTEFHQAEQKLDEICAGLGQEA